MASGAVLGSTHLWLLLLLWCPTLSCYCHCTGAATAQLILSSIGAATGRQRLPGGMDAILVPSLGQHLGLILLSPTPSYTTDAKIHLSSLILY